MINNIHPIDLGDLDKALDKFISDPSWKNLTLIRSHGNLYECGIKKYVLGCCTKCPISKVIKINDRVSQVSCCFDMRPNKNGDIIIGEALSSIYLRALELRAIIDQHFDIT